MANWVASTDSAADPAQTGSALLLWFIVALGLLVFLIGLILVTVSRRSSRQRAPANPTSDIDAWKTAAERLETPALPDE